MDVQRPYRLHPQVSLRPEPFGALAYHFGNRRLSFLRSPDIVAVVKALESAPSVLAALDACGIAESRRPSFERALSTLEASEMIVAQSTDDGGAGRAA